MHKADFVQISVTFVDSSSSGPVFQQLTVIVRNIGHLAFCANAGARTLSAFIDSIVGNVLLQTNWDLTSFLNLSTSLNQLMHDS